MVYENGKYIVTKASGTVVEIPGSLSALQSDTYSDGATMNYDKITYPNGFSISVERKYSGMTAPILSVTTNTGLQLKYHYAPQSRPLPANQNKAISWPGNNIPDDGLDWSTVLPASVTAINQGIEYCSDTESCTLTQSWPTATYQWPAGMPKAAYVGDTIFTVTDSAGRTTEYHHTPVDIDPIPQDKRFAVRLKKVKTAQQSVPAITYDYVNVFDPSPIYQMFYYYRKNIGPATLVSATNKGLSSTYNVGANGVQDTSVANTWKHSSTKAAINGQSLANIVYRMDNYWNVPKKIETWDQDVIFESQGNKNINTLAPILNRVKRIEHKRGKGATEYEYDARGNLTKIWRSDRGHGSQNEGSYLYVEEAMYPTSCPNPKTCNKPRWVKDGRGNATSYTYHAQSGQIATVLKPADNAGHRAKIRYGYTQKYAWYKNSSGTLVRADTPIWLLTSEKQCRIGATLPDDSGCVTDGAEIVTTYYYGTEDGSKANNLWMTGYTVTADGQSRTTCYTHDKLGNTLSETQPNAGLSSCP